MKKCYRLLLAVLSGFSTLHAQDSIPSLQQVTVTASLLEKKQRETGRNIFSIPGTRLQQLPVHSIDELLKYLPGVEVQQRGPQGAQSNILLRGGTFQQVLVILDGIRLNDPLTGHFNSYIPINLAEVERIEILKGAAAAIYGSEAVGGVIQIISKTFHRKTTLKQQAYGKLATGDYRLLNAALYGRKTVGKNWLSAGFQTNNADGTSLRGTNGYFHWDHGNIAWSGELSPKITMAFRSAIDRRSFNAQNFYTSFVSDTAREKVSSWWNQLQLTIKAGSGSIRFDAGYKQLRDRYWFRPVSQPNDNRSGLFNSQFYYSSNPAAKSGITTGMQWNRKQIRSNDRGNHDLWHGAAYAIFYQRLPGGFHLQESLRTDWDQNYGWILVPQVNLAWSQSRFTLRTSGGRSFRDADFTERYNNYNKTLVTGGSIGNPDLRPEQAWNLEAGADYQSNTGFRFSSTVFYRWFRNLIDWSPTPYAEMPRQTNLVPSGNYSLASNIETIRSAGWEADLFYHHQFRDRFYITGSAGYTFIRSVNDDPVPSFYISSHARHLLNMSWFLQVRSFSISMTGLYKERKAREASPIQAKLTPSYFIFSSRIGWSPVRQILRVYVQGDNIGNRRYSDLLGAEMPGRWLSAGIEVNL